MLQGILAGLAAGALWGLVFVAPRMVGGYSSVDLTAGRFVAYGAVAAFVMLVTRGRPLPTASQALASFGMSLLGFTGYYLLLVLAIRDAGTEVPSLVIGTIPIWVMLLGKPAHLSWKALVPGLLLTAAGLALMISSPHAEGANVLRGVLLAVASLVCWTAFALLNSKWLKKHPEVNATDWANWLGIATGLGAIVLWAVAGSPARELVSREGRGLFALLCIGTGFGAAWLATILWNIASRRLSASLCGQLIVSETLFALAYSFAWDGRWPTPAQGAACVLFTLGILASIRAHR
ncbi:DMT family transporter [Ramlibacter albus]|uniref:DMT family transporter n=1 Tax=Ramlibacter albus TaxID=2079448 RepID=A0A923M9W0_9BURK|nr:DMT family transporter [Ramlibacter albus]